MCIQCNNLILTGFKLQTHKQILSSQTGSGWSPQRPGKVVPVVTNYGLQVAGEDYESGATPENTGKNTKWMHAGMRVV